MESENFNVEFEEVVNIGGGTSDFNELSNRPKYNNETMTGDTNIPEVPTKTSDLTNDGADGTSTYVEADNLATVATSGDYDDLSNKPTIPTVNNATLTITQNGVSKGTFTANASDDTTIEVPDTIYSDFTGTDGTTAGTHGLVPAPATTDAGKFLKADGTWDTAGGDGVIELTTADYNWPTNNPTSVALWLLEPALYSWGVDTRIYWQSDRTLMTPGVAQVWDSNSGYKQIEILSNNDVLYVTKVNSTSGLVGSSAYPVKLGGSSTNVVQTTGTSTTDVMSQDAITKMVYPMIATLPNAINIRGASGIDTATADYAIAVGTNATARGERTVSIGYGTSDYANGDRSVVIGNFAKVNNNSKGIAIGNLATCSNPSSIALGSSATTSRVGEVNIGAGTSGEGYNSTNYRVIGGVHDGQLDNDAVTVEQVNAVIDAINTALSTNISHIGSGN